MIQRCTNPNDKRFAKYGGRGIKVCDRWRHDFAAFVADVGERPEGVGEGGRALYSIDRIDNDRGYEPGNVRWATSREQRERTTRSRLLTYKGELLPLTRWAERMGLRRTTLEQRLGNGWSVERALSAPVRRQR